MKVTLLFFDGCPNWQVTEASLATLADELGFELERFRLESEDDAQRWYFRGSPTVLIDGRDAFSTGDEPIGLSCRVYRTDRGLAGAPTVDQLRDVLTAANS